MMIRPIEWLRDGAALLASDTSFTTERIYRVSQKGLSISLNQEFLLAPLKKNYPLHNLEKDVLSSSVALLAHERDCLVGFAVIKEQVWNRRAELTHLYVSPGHRGRGIGQSMISNVIALLQPSKCRCLWAETQNTNYAAVRFYLKAGFRLCGFDCSLYDGPLSEETAVFLQRDLKPNPRAGGDAGRC